jgi:hypothetical protein
LPASLPDPKLPYATTRAFFREIENGNPASGMARDPAAARTAVAGSLQENNAMDSLQV